MRVIFTLIVFLLAAPFAESQNKPSLPTPPVATVRFYPNPAISQITFDFQGNYDKNYSLQIYSLIGKKVYESSSLPSSKITLDLADFYRGVYIFQIKDKNGKIIESGRFQVSK